MSTLLGQVLMYMSCTFLFGLILGWILWKFGSAEKMSSMDSEVNFWKKNLEQSRLERDNYIQKIATLDEEKTALKRRLAAAAAAAAAKP